MLHHVKRNQRVNTVSTFRQGANNTCTEILRMLLLLISCTAVNDIRGATKKSFSCVGQHLIWGFRHMLKYLIILVHHFMTNQTYVLSQFTVVSCIGWNIKL